MNVRYRSLMLPEGDLDADTVEVPAARRAPKGLGFRVSDFGFRV